MRWHHHESTGAVVIDRTLREEMVESVKLFLEQHPDEPYCVESTGDTLVIGTSNLDGEVSVYDARIRSEWFAERAMAPRRYEQPPPRASTHPAIWPLVVAEMQARDKLGRERYGVPLQPHNGRDALRDLYEELLDACAYARQALYERDGR